MCIFEGDCGLFMKIKKTHWLIMLVASFVYLLPMMISGGVTYYEGQDTYFHLARVVGLTNVFESPVNFLTFNHTGVMVNEFYPWLTLLPMNWLFQLSENIVFAYWTYFYLLTVITMVIAYRMFQLVDEKFKDGNAPLVFAVLYAVSTYRTADLLTRSAVGEVITLTFLPLIFAGLYHVIKGDYKKWYLISVGMALVVYSHMVTLLLVAIVMAAIILTTFWFWQEKWQRVLALVEATVVTVALGAFALVPFAEQSLYQKIYTPEAKELFGQPIVEYVVKTGINWLQGTALGPVLILGLGLVIWQRHKLAQHQRFLLWVTVVMIVLMTSLFPWQLVADTKIGQGLSQIQFLWRFNGIITLFLSYLVTIGVFAGGFLPLNAFSRRYSVLAGVLIVIQLAGMTILHLTGNPQVLNHESAMIKANSISYYKDYRPDSSIAKKTAIDKHQVVLGGKYVRSSWIVTDSNYQLDVTNKNNKTQELVVPVFHYLGQRVTVNGKPATFEQSKFGTTAIMIPKGEATVEIQTDYTIIAKTSAVISLLASATLAIWLYKTRERNRETEPVVDAVLA